MNSQGPPVTRFEGGSAGSAEGGMRPDSCCQRYFLAAVKILTQACISSIIASKTPISAEWLGISSALEIVPLVASAATSGISSPWKATRHLPTLLRVWHLLHEESQPLFSQDLLHAPDGVTILIKQEANSL